jgi:Protein of unknown function (DUF1168)
VPLDCGYVCRTSTASQLTCLLVILSRYIVKAEKVSNPYGSTAGAGSGEFHVYRHARSREMDRWKQIDEQEKLERLDQEYQEKLAKDSQETALKTDKNRKKRHRQKEAKLRKKNLELSGVAAAIVAQEGRKDGKRAYDSNDEKDEFAYQPISEEKSEDRTDIADDSAEGDAKLPAIPNLEAMEEKMAPEQQQEPMKNDFEGEARPTKRQAT